MNRRLDTAITVHVDGKEIGISPHAVDRYQQRVKPCMDFVTAGKDIRRIAQAAGVVQRTSPNWMAVQDSQNTAWLELGPDTVFPLRETGKRFVATTCITTDAVSDKTLQRRRNKRSKKTRARRERDEVRAARMRMFGSPE